VGRSSRPAQRWAGAGARFGLGDRAGGRGVDGDAHADVPGARALGVQALARRGVAVDEVGMVTPGTEAPKRRHRLAEHRLDLAALVHRNEP